MLAIQLALSFTLSFLLEKISLQRSHSSQKHYLSVVNILDTRTIKQGLSFPIIGWDMDGLCSSVVAVILYNYNASSNER